jgi:hypothetical protein
MICEQSKRWWNGGILEHRSQLGRGQRRRRRSAATVQAKAEIQKSVQKANGKMWNDYLKNLRGAEALRAAQFAIPRAGSTVEALPTDDGKQANMISPKEEMCRQEYFHPNEYTQYIKLRPAGHAQQSVTVQAVQRD